MGVRVAISGIDAGVRAALEKHLAEQGHDVILIEAPARDSDELRSLFFGHDCPIALILSDPPERDQDRIGRLLNALPILPVHVEKDKSGGPPHSLRAKDWSPADQRNTKAKAFLNRRKR